MSATSLDPNVETFLTTHLLNRGLFLTYRLLSRELSLHVREARDALAAFYDLQGKEKLRACWVVQGSLKSKADSMQVDGDEEAVKEEAILLVGEDKLQDTIRLFSPKPSVQIYSLSTASPKGPALTSMDLSNFSTVPLRLSSEPKYVKAWEQAERGKKLGVLYNERVAEGDPRAVAAAREQMALQVKSPSAAVDTKPVKEERKPSTNISSTTQAGKNGGISWSKAKPKATAESSATAPAASSSKLAASKKSEPPPKAQVDEADEEEGESYNSDVEMAQIGYADSEAEQEEIDERPIKAAKSRKADGVPAQKSIASEKGTGRKTVGAKTVNRKSASRAELEKMMETDEDEDQPGEAIPNVESSTSALTSLMEGNEEGGEKEIATRLPVKRRVRRQKRTVRKQRTKDEKGYMRTQEISDYESYSDWTESEETSAAAPSKKSVQTKAKSTGGVGEKKSKASRTESASSVGSASRIGKDVPAVPVSAMAEETGDEASTTTTAAAAAAATAARPSKSPSPSKQAPLKSGASGGGGGGGSKAAKGGQSKLSSFFKKG